MRVYCFAKVCVYMRRVRVWPASWRSSLLVSVIKILITSLIKSHAVYKAYILPHYQTNWWMSLHKGVLRGGGAAAQRGVWPHSSGFSWSHITDTTQSVGLLWTSDQLVAETSTCKYTTLTIDKTSMPPVEFEPTISAGGRPQTYALDRAATETGITQTLQTNSTTDTVSGFGCMRGVPQWGGGGAGGGAPISS